MRRSYIKHSSGFAKAAHYDLPTRDAAASARASGWPKRATWRAEARVRSARLRPRGACQENAEIGRAHVCTPVTNAHLVCRLLLEKQTTRTTTTTHSQLQQTH